MKICLIGCGKQSEKYTQSLLKMDGVSVIATDINKDTREQFGNKFNCETVETLDEALNYKDLAGGIICTPIPAHKSAAESFIKSGLPFMCEKPLSMSGEESQDIANAAKLANVSAGVTYTYRYVPAFKELKEQFQKQNCAIGAPVTALFRIGGRGNHRIWKHMRPAGGVTNEMFCHMLDLALWLFGGFESLTIRDQKTIQPERMIGGESCRTDAEDYVYIEGMTKTGVQCIFISDFITPSFSQFLEVQGSNGSFFGSIQPHFESRFLINNNMGDMTKGEHLIDGSGPSVVDKIVHELVDVIKENGSFRCSLEDANQTQNYLDKVIAQLN
jgi:predicted dehydrogenase